MTSTPMHEARCLVVEALYEAETSDHEPVAVLHRRLDEARVDSPALADPKLQRRAERMLVGVITELGAEDELIAAAAPKYPLGDMAIVDRNILRLAIWELLTDASAPVPAVVNEAVELAHRYGGDKSPSFVNGVLRTVSQQIQDGRDAAARTPPPEFPQHPQEN